MVDSWVRSYTLEHGKRFVISDRYRLAENKYDAALPKATVENIDITDSKLRAGVGEKVPGLVFELQDNQLNGHTGF